MDQDEDLEIGNTIFPPVSSEYGYQVDAAFIARGTNRAAMGLGLEQALKAMDKMAENFPSSGMGTSEEREHMSAVATMRKIETLEIDPLTGVAPGASREDYATAILHEVTQRLSAKTMLLAIESDGKGSIPELNLAQNIMVQEAQADPEFAKDLKNIAAGDFHQLSPQVASGLKGAMNMPLQGRIAESMQLVDREFKMRESRNLSSVMLNAAQAHTVGM